MKLLQISIVASVVPLLLQTACATVMVRPSLEKREIVYGIKLVSLCSVQLTPCYGQRLKKLTRSMFLDTIVTVTEVRYVPMAMPSQAPAPAPVPERPAPQVPPQAGLFFFAVHQIQHKVSTSRHFDNKFLLFLFHLPCFLTIATHETVVHDMVTTQLPSVHPTSLFRLTLKSLHHLLIHLHLLKPLLHLLPLMHLQLCLLLLLSSLQLPTLLLLQLRGPHLQQTL